MSGTFTLVDLIDDRTGVYYDRSRDAHVFVVYHEDQAYNVGECSAMLPEAARRYWSREVATEVLHSIYPELSS